jgi:hypothetical protein
MWSLRQRRSWTLMLDNRQLSEWDITRPSAPTTPTPFVGNFSLDDPQWY